MKDPIFTGSAAALITPFTETGVDYSRLEELIEFHIKNNTDALVVCATTGEAPTLPDEEHEEILRFVVDKTAKRIPVIAGTGSNYTAHAVAMSRFAEKIGADGVLIVAPYYNKTTQKGLCAHIKTIAESINIPIILYNIPGRTGGLSFSIDTLKEISKIPNVNGIKEATGDLAFAAKVAAETDLVLYSGNDDVIVPIMSLGGKGVISVAANIIPQEIHDICAKYMEGNTTESKEIFLKYLKLLNTLFIEVNPIPVKTAMGLMGMDSGILRQPLFEMEDKNLETLKSVLKEYDLLKQQ